MIRILLDRKKNDYTKNININAQDFPNLTASPVG